MNDYVARLLREISLALRPLSEALDDLDSLSDLFNELGWDLPIEAATTLAGQLETVRAALDDLVQQENYDVTRLAQGLSKVAAALADCVPTVLDVLSAPLDQPEFWTGLADDLLQMLVVDYLDVHHPMALGVLAVLGIARSEQMPAEEESGRLPYRRRTLDLSAASSFVSSPGAALRQRYQWGGQFDHEAAIWALGTFMRGIGAPTSVDAAEGALLDAFLAPLSEFRGSVDRLVVSAPGLNTGNSWEATKAALVVMPTPPETNLAGRPDGLSLLPIFLGAASGTFVLSDAVTLAISGNVIDTPVAVRLSPTGVQAIATAEDLEVGLDAKLDITPKRPILIVGDSTGSRVELHRAHLSLRASTQGDTVELSAEAGLDHLRITVAADANDGFLREVMGATPAQGDVGVQITWSSVHGLHLAGLDSVNIDLPLILSIGNSLRLDMMHLSADTEADGTVIVQLGVDGGVGIGPFAATVRGLGATGRVRATPALTPGNGAIVDLQFGAKPPTGVGLTIDTTAVSGGGFLNFDPKERRYSGIFELTLMGSIKVKAIALITTRMPDGSEGFSLLILITAENFTPIQLGMGFTLTGIGGLIALNRTVDEDVVRTGLQDGMLDSILFMKDPVKNANRVLTTLDRIFPAAKDHLVVGPLAEISWGTPAIVHLRLALLLDLPAPVRAVILAALSVKLPRPEHPVVEIHVDAIGVIDFTNGRIALDASLHDSRILSFVLTGDLALRLDWGTHPDFLLSIGGFHPRFTPPAGLRQLKRVSLQLTTGKNPQVRFEAYLAITSNTLQMGAKATFQLEVAGFGVSGGGSFDALIQWSPFHLEVDLTAFVKISLGDTTLLALSLAMTVTGPEPWHITGTAEFDIWFLSVSVPVDLTLGSSPTSTDPVESVDVADLIWQEVGTPSAWQAVLPQGTSAGVTLTGGAPNPERVLSHPLAYVSVRQKVVPLDERITHVGARMPRGGARSYDLALTLPEGVIATPLTDLFAPAQFSDMTGEEKLSAPSFVELRSGWALEPVSASSSGPSMSWPAVVDTFDVTDFDVAATPSASAAAYVSTSNGSGGWG